MIVNCYKFRCMKKLIFILSIISIIYSCSKTQMKTPLVILTGCDSIKQGFLKNRSDSLRLLSCIIISGCDSLRLGVLKPNKQDTLRLLSCIKISGCDSLDYGLIKTKQDSLRLNCNFVTIGKQKWMAKNLEVATYRNGDIIPQVTDPIAWAALTTGAWCYYNNDPFYGAMYGKLYNWYAVIDARGLAPKGWHIPIDEEWATISTFLGGDDIAGGKMKTTVINLWAAPNNSATNESGFTGFPGGYRYSDGTFFNVGGYGVWWSATQLNAANAGFRYLYFNAGYLGKNSSSEKNAFSVRCLRD